MSGAGVSTRSLSRREAEVTFGRHLQNDHQSDRMHAIPPTKPSHDIAEPATCGCHRRSMAAKLTSE